MRVLRLIPALVLLFSAFPLQAASAAYISNCCNLPSTVSVFSTASNQQTGYFPVDTGAADIVFSPDGTLAYVTNNVTQSVSVVQTATQTVVATIPLGYGVSLLTISPDGSQLFVESYDGISGGQLIAIDTATMTVTNTLAFLNPFLLGQSNVSPDGTKLYVPFGELLVIDTSTLQISAQIPVENSISVVLTPDGRFAYVANFGTGDVPNVAVVDTSTDQVVATIPLNATRSLGQIAVSPDGSLAYLPIDPLNGLIPGVVVIQTSTNQVITTIPLRGANPYIAVFSPDGTRAYVTDSNHSAVDVIDVSQNALIAVLTTLGSVGGLAVSPDGTTLYVPNSGSSWTFVIDTSTGKDLAHIPVGDMSGGSSTVQSGASGATVTSPDGRRVYVSNYVSNNVAVIDTATNQVIKSVPVGQNPTDLILSPDGTHAYTTNQFSFTVIDTRTFAVTQITRNIGYLSALAITPNGKYVYAAGTEGGGHGVVFVIDTSTNTIVTTIPTSQSYGIGISRDGTRAYVNDGGTLSVIDMSTNTIIASIQFQNGWAPPGSTAGVVVSPDGTRVFTDGGGPSAIYEIDVTQNKLLKRIQVGRQPGQLALSPDRNLLYAMDYVSSSASVIDVASGTVKKTIPLGNPSYGIAFTH